jgi:hypothetical protein
MTFFGFAFVPQGTPVNIFNGVELSSLSLSVVTTVLSTVIISIRILMVSRMPGASRKLWITLEIIVESALLYSISALVLIPMIALLASSDSAVTYYGYAQLFFTYMAVESHRSSFPVLNS